MKKNCFSNKNSFDALDNWLSTLKAKAPANSVMFLIGNKSDKAANRVVDIEIARVNKKKFRSLLYY
jgi:GTPase SAR1 family protein